MLVVINVILPVFLLIFLGYLFRRYNFPSDSFWAPVEKLTYFALFPCLITLALATVEAGEMPIVRMIVSIIGPLLIISSLVLLIRPRLRLSGPQFSSVYQGAVRMNTYIGLSIAYGLYGNQGLASAAIAIAAIVPFVNFTCVMVLVSNSAADKSKNQQLWKRVAMNPLIIACLVGVLLNITGIGKPPIIGSLAEILSQAALPLGLLAVGSSITFRDAKKTTGLALFTASIKLVALPLITWLFLSLFEVNGIAAAVAVLFSGLPTAPSAYILAKQLGGDDLLIASLITWQTLISVITLPLLIVYLA